MDDQDEFNRIIEPNILGMQRKLPNKLGLKKDKLSLKDESIINLRHTTEWNYSITKTSKIEGDLRLTIRGFNTFCKTPKNFENINYNFEDEYWNIISKNENNDLIRIYVSFKRLFLSGEITIDRWGLLRGTAFTKDEFFDNSLYYLHLLLCNIENEIW